MQSTVVMENWQLMDRSIGNPDTGIYHCSHLAEGVVPPVLGNPETGDHPCAEVDQRDVSAIGSKCANNEYEVTGGNKKQNPRCLDLFRLQCYENDTRHTIEAFP
jgi:hypothetical protein